MIEFIVFHKIEILVVNDLFFYQSPFFKGDEGEFIFFNLMLNPPTPFDKGGIFSHSPPLSRRGIKRDLYFS